LPRRKIFHLSESKFRKAARCGKETRTERRPEVSGAGFFISSISPTTDSLLTWQFREQRRAGYRHEGHLEPIREVTLNGRHCNQWHGSTNNSAPGTDKTTTEPLYVDDNLTNDNSI
jgi:hypothetical protein